MARFSYIDPDGKEVEIGGTSQLGSRISLGAVTDTTLLYDGATDKWAPAAEHAIFRELKETLGPASAPPEAPPAEPPAEEAAAETPAEPPEDSEAPAPEDQAAPAEASDPAAGAAPPAEPSAEEPTPPEVDEPEAGPDSDDPLGLDMDLTLSGDEAATTAPSTGDGADDDDFGMGDLTLAEDDGTDESDDAASFDFDGGLELEDEPEDVAEPVADLDGSGPEEEEPRGDPFEMEQGPPAAAASDDEEEEDDAAPSFEFDGGLELEEEEEDEEEDDEEEGDAAAGISPMEEVGMFDEDEAEAGGFGDGSLVAGTSQEEWARSDDDEDDFSGGLEVEEDEEPSEADSPREPAGAGASRKSASDSDAGAESGEAREARARPRPPARKPEKSSGGILTLIIILAVLGGGGWFGYQFFLGGGSSTAEREVAGPGPNPADSRTVPSGLQEPMAAVAAAAADSMSAWVDSLLAARDLGERPPEEWLDGIYLAHASEYPGVEAYWSGFRDLLNTVEENESARFQAAYDAALADQGVTGDDASQLRSWAMEDFQWASFNRSLAYGSLHEVTGAALDLHALLVEREEDIGYELLEAVPADQALQDQIDAQIDRITGALDDLDALGEVTTERLTGIVQQGFRDSIGAPPRAAAEGG